MTDTTDLFLITGATGKTGVPTVELLRERGFRVRASTRTSFESQGQYAAWASVA
jgi:uncharacterized protein YbjT (DUF2867 family)